MARLCERPGCSERGSVSYGFDADRLLVWLAPLDPEVERARAGVLCKRHADSLVLPRGWTLDDRRDPQPPLFRTQRATRRKRATRRPQPRTAPLAQELPLEPDAPTVTDSLDNNREHDVRPGDPDDTTGQLVWMPVFDARDDLDGLLRADTPLLARAFLGAARQR